MSITLALPSKGRLKDDSIARLTFRAAEPAVSSLNVSVRPSPSERLPEARP
jgi:ATP phosphoribosyltransferase